mgnify:CR=1 FL=1
MEYTIPLRCMSKARPRVTRKGWTYMPRPYVKWKQDVAAILRSQHVGPPLQGNLSLTAHIDLTPKGGRPPDLDNLIGAILDAANSILFHDDAQLSALHLSLDRRATTNTIHLSLIPTADNPEL